MANRIEHPAPDRAPQQGRSGGSGGSGGPPLADLLVEAAAAAARRAGEASTGSVERPNPMVDRPDAKVLAAADSMMPPAADARLAELTDQRRERTLTRREEAEFVALTEQYFEGQIRKSQGLAEAVRRGLRKPRAP